ncbi:MAG: winged helix-turn-helix domain-containing protein [Vulcanimicrobiaceae bacterium]
MSQRRSDLSASQARRIALAAQAFGTVEGTVTARRLRTLVQRLGAVQIDSVNVLVRSHFLPAFSRFGAYDRATLERLAYGRKRRLFEYWAHEASLVPIELYPLFRWRMERARQGRGTWGNVARVGREAAELVERVRATIASNGPMSASQFTDAKSTGSWWGWSDTKRALEFLFWSGQLLAATRRPSFERVYDLPERILPLELLHAPQMTERDAHRTLLAIAARAFGIATQADLCDYFRLDAVDAALPLAELVEEGCVRRVNVDGWKQPAYLHRDAPLPRRMEAHALLSPFDSLVWNRKRTKRLFDFHYRIEIYTPAHKRIHGYYVLPYLFGETLVARVDVKADRAAGSLLVHAVHLEPNVDARSLRPRLREDLKAMAQWLGLERVRMPR